MFCLQCEWVNILNDIFWRSPTTIILQVTQTNVVNIRFTNVKSNNVIWLNICVRHLVRRCRNMAYNNISSMTEGRSSTNVQPHDVQFMLRVCVCLRVHARFVWQHISHWHTNASAPGECERPALYCYSFVSTHMLTSKHTIRGALGKIPSMHKAFAVHSPEQTAYTIDKSMSCVDKQPNLLAYAIHTAMGVLCLLFLLPSSFARKRSRYYSR